MITVFERNMTQQFFVVSCYSCGVRFGITDLMYRRAVTNAEGSVFCPSCGKETCWRESDDQKKIRQLQRDLETEQRRAETAKRRAEAEEKQRITTEHQLRATKGVVTRIKNRVVNGACPCCNRTFHDLQRHMSTKHPDYATATQS